MTQDPKHMVTQVLGAIRAGDAGAVDALLPLVYAELRRLARARMSRAPVGQTLQPTALVHEAYLKLVADDTPGWENRAHFFASAAQAMRHILVDQARRRNAAKRGGGQEHANVDDVDLPIEPPNADILALDRALATLEAEDPRKGQIVALRYFAGLAREEVAQALGISLRTVDREWRYIQARLHRDMTRES